MSEIEAFIAAQSAAFNAVKAPPAPAPPVQAPGPALVVQAAPAPALVVMAQAIAPNPLAPHMDAILDEEARNLVKQGAEAEKDVILEDGGVLPISINIVELFGETPNEGGSREPSCIPLRLQTQSLRKSRAVFIRPHSHWHIAAGNRKTEGMEDVCHLSGDGCWDVFVLVGISVCFKFLFIMTLVGTRRGTMSLEYPTIFSKVIAAIRRHARTGARL